MSAFRRRKINLPRTVGARLKKERRRQKLTLEDAEEATKIRLRYLKALEADRFDQFPQLVYMLGFVRRYARFLALETDEIVEQFRQEHKEFAGEKLALGIADEPKVSRIIVTPRVAIGVVAALLILAVVGYIVFSVNKLSQPPAIEIVSPTTPTTSERNLAIEGKTLATATVEINNQTVNVDDRGHFMQKAELSSGINIFEIKAKSRLGKESTEVLRILYDAGTGNEKKN